MKEKSLFYLEKHRDLLYEKRSNIEKLVGDIDECEDLTVYQNITRELIDVMKEIDLLQERSKPIYKCPKCGNDMRIVTVIQDFYQPDSFFGHGQVECEVLICEGCDNEETL